MKTFNIFQILLLSLITFMFSCTENEEKVKKEKELPLIETIDGVYTEYYPGRKSVKIQGQVDENNLRHSKWTFYSETGTELSITHYIHGKKEGHSIVKFPNGMLNYYGEYHDDVKIGIWKKYDEKGKLLEETDFGTGVK